MTPANTVTLYIARNHLGQYSCGQSWVDDFKDGRFYTKRGPVSGWVTRWMQSNPREPVPEVLMWVIDPVKAQVFGTPGEVKKRVAKVARNKEKRKQERDANLLAYRKEEVCRLQTEIARLEGRT